jgi:hypothetical protein
MLVGTARHGNPPAQHWKETMNTAMIDALLIEREGYVKRNLAARVKEVDAQLSALGHKTKRSESVVETATAEVEVETAAKPAPKKRATR